LHARCRRAAVGSGSGRRPWDGPRGRPAGAAHLGSRRLVLPRRARRRPRERARPGRRRSGPADQAPAVGRTSRCTRRRRGAGCLRRSVSNVMARSGSRPAR